MFRDALAQFHAVQQTPPALTQASMEPHNVPNQLLAESKHLRDFRKYNPKMFEGSLKDPAKTQMWLASVETIFRYMKCSNNKKIIWKQFKESFYAKFFFSNLKYTKQQEFLNLEKDDMTVEQHDVEFDMLSCFTPEVVANEVVRTDKFVDMSLHERADPSKAVGKGSTSGRKRKAEL
ncbi:gag-protease polyprotein [Cucumis melo var. makuwa]|uniref:Gag-protease polyprotein n=1 Tax=Cucumis melo var. makuwa TaxID=1194695 RepID=A0A5D3BE04_CUCMM|nr:gag-protease polyprotein [Cucumis melo var. makuwa]